MRKIYVFALGLLLAGVPQTGSAQFFKKLGKVLEEVDKALDDGSSKKEEVSGTKTPEANTQASVAQGGEIHRGNYHKTKLKTVVPCRTPATKLIPYTGTIPQIGPFADGLAYVRPGGDQGGYFMDVQGNKVFSYDMGFMGDMPVFSCGRFVTLNSRTHEAKILDTKGQVVKVIPKVMDYTQFVDGVAALTVKVQFKNYWETYVMYINTDGEYIFKNLICKATMENLKPVSPLRENRAAYYDYPKQRWGYRDAEGKVVVQPSFVAAKDFSDGLALVAVSDGSSGVKWGYIDATGAFVIPPSYDKMPGSFSGGLAPVAVKEQRMVCYYIDKTGKRVSQPYQYATEFHNGCALVAEEGKRKVLNTRFETIAYGPEASDLDYPFPCYGEEVNTDITWKDKDVYLWETLVTPQCDMVLHPVSSPFNEGYAPCNMAHYQSPDEQEHAGLINRKGEFVWEFVK